MGNDSAIVVRNGPPALGGLSASIGGGGLDTTDAAPGTGYSFQAPSHYLAVENLFVPGTYTFTFLFADRLSTGLGQSALLLDDFQLSETDPRAPPPAPIPEPGALTLGFVSAVFLGLFWQTRRL